MKKVLAILTIAVFATSFTACKKEYTCSCTYNDPITGITVTLDHEFEKMKKQEAEEDCEDLEAVHKLVDSTATCSI